ncbi:MAG TPA: hypothetical protein VMB78_07980 [Dissulfurispiraceae bacterium]|nr:hypothetical protein [Dissulfurispiraceae bacterium]
MKDEMKEKYQRLPGKGRRKKSIIGFSRLYLSSDHLLCVSNAAYTEDYRRFYFKDIQAIVVAANLKREKMAAGYLGTALLLLLFAFWKGGNWSTFFMILAALFLLNVAVSWHRGPTCSCRLYTAASREDLPSLGRIRNAKKVMEILRPLITENQRGLSADIRPAATGPEAPSSLPAL